MTITVEHALQAAAQRKADLDLSYAGALTPPEAYTVLREKAQTALVDVRTQPELQYVGHIGDALEIAWQFYPDMQINDRFTEMLQEKIAPERTVLFLCRSGVRSHYAAAAAAAAGYESAYNVLEGFEGDLNADGQRGALNGWRFHGLPWVQS